MSALNPESGGVTETLRRLEREVLSMIDEGREVRISDIESAFPLIARRDIQRVLESTLIVHAWMRDLAASGDGAPKREADWLNPGARLGGYLVQRRVPGGAMGQVYQAVQVSLYPREVALKVYRLGPAPEVELRRARREAEVASRLVHPHLVAIHDLGYDAERGLVYISMQFVDGPDLRVELLGEQQPEDRASERARVRRLVTRVSEVAGALAELHGRGYVHRDVKPENILLRRNAGRDGATEAAVLVDFGLVRAERVLGTAEHAFSLAGTPGYAPPEADSSGEAVKPTWDVYSLGVVMYELLRARPLVRDAAAKPLRPVLAGLLDLPANLDADLHAVLTRALEPDPANRYPDAGAFQEDLERWLDGLSVNARRPPLHERLWRSARRSPRRTMLFAIVVALIVVLTQAAAWVIRQTNTLTEAETALAGGLPAKGWRLLQSVEPLFVKVFQGDDGVARDALQGTSAHPLTQVALAELDRGEPSALQLAAAYLERDGYSSDGIATHPRLQAFLLRSIARDSPSHVREQAMTVLARLFYERPVVDPDAFLITDPLRIRLHEYLFDPLAKREEHVAALCALGGLGSLQTLELLLEIIDCADVDWEPTRLTVAAMERILLRLRSVERRDDLLLQDWNRLEGRLSALWHEAQAAGFGDDHLYHVRLHWQRLALAWIFLNRDLGREVLQQNRSAFEVDFPQGFPRSRSALRAGDLSMHAEILQRIETREKMGEAWFERWSWAYAMGELCAFIGSGDLVAGATSAMRADEQLTALLPSFEQGWREGRAMVESGRYPIMDPDPRSLSRWLLTDATQAESLRMQHNSVDDSSALVQWEFGKNLTRRSHAAAPTVGGGTYWLPSKDNPAHLRFPRVGSWVELDFHVEMRARPRAWMLEVVHQAASRAYLPFHGQAWIRVELDGAVLVDRLLVRQTGAHDLGFTLQLEGTLTPPGMHTLRLTLIEASTTYWLHRVTLDSRE